MGQTHTKEEIENLTLPSGNNYMISYCRGYDVTKRIKCSKETNLELLISQKKLNVQELIYSIFKYKIDFLGYSIQDLKIPPFDQIPLNIYLNQIKIMDLEITSTCYNVKLSNIKYLLNKGNIIIAGLILDEEFLKETFNLISKEISTDIVLIIGYNLDFIIIKTGWISSPVNIPLRLLDNFKEMWSIKIQSPEEKYNINLNEI